ASSEVPSEPLLREIAPRQCDRRRGKVDAGDAGAASGEPRQVDPGAAADFQNRSSAVAVKSDEPQQVMQLFEVVLVEVVEEAAGADWMRRDLEVVNVAVPVRTDR